MRSTARLWSSLPPTVRDSLTRQGETTVHGWVRSVRAHKNVAFAEVDDGSGSSVQAVLKGKGRADGLTQGSAVRLHGHLVPSRGAGQAMELAVSSAEVLGPCDPDLYPVQKKALPPPVLREHAHLRFRTSQTAAIMRVRDALARDWHDWMEANEFVHIHTPLLTASDCEGAGETFALASNPDKPFFPTPVNLTVSGQLHLEAPTLALSRAYTLSPCFRAEPSQTSRHLAEFYMLEAEVAFVDSLPQLLDVIEASVRGTLKSLLDSDKPRAQRARRDLERIAALNAELAAELGEASAAGGKAEGKEPLAHLHAVADTPFARIAYTDAIALLAAQHAQAPFEHAPKWHQGLSSEHEKWLAGVHFGKPVFVTDYPAAQKPFYMLPSAAASSASPEAPSAASAASEAAAASAPSAPPGPTVAAFDLLFPHIGEMAGGSLREHRLAPLLAAIEKGGMKPEDYEWYLDLRRYGAAPHGGWGMGWERWVCWVTGVQNVRDVVAFPRWAGSCRF